MIKVRGKIIIQWMCCLCTQMWMSGTVPDDWKMASLFAFPRKATWPNVTAGENNIAISPWKGICQMILNWMCEVVDSQLHEEQAWFRTNQLCTEQIFTLNNIIEKCQKYQAPLAIWFINFSKAFDSIHQPALWKLLILYEVPDEHGHYIIKKWNFELHCSEWW